MIEVGEGSFTQWFPDIESKIKSSSFIAIDLEFLGLPSSSNSRCISLFDSPSERYTKLREGIKKFPPCQLGIACFKEVTAGFEVEVFNIYLFKRLCKRVFSFSLSALTFLSHHNFDFNKFVSDGVTYLNRKEYDKMKKEIYNGTFDYDNLTDNLQARLQMLKLRILTEADVEDETFKNEPIERSSFCQDERIRLPYPLLIELCTKDVPEDMDDYDTSGLENEPVLWDGPLTSVEAAAIVFVLSQEFPFFDFQLDASRTLLYVAEIPLICRNSIDKRRKKVILKTFLNELLGVSRIFHVISENKKPLIGHNSLLDFMYIYQYFETDLPETYDCWKAGMNETFFYVLDTKVLAASVQDTLSRQGVTDLSLQTLGTYFDSPSCGSILPFETPEIIIGEHMASHFTNEQYHNAGFDAFTTGKVFLKIVHLYAYTRCAASEFSKMPWPFQKLTILLKSRITNRISIPLIDSQCCYLNGDDPIGFRPDIIHVRKKRSLEWLMPLSRFNTFHETIASYVTFILPPIKISIDECLRLQDDLSRILGAFRVEVKTDGSTLFLATNTANSYARVCSFFTVHEEFYLLDEVSGTLKSYEQRLTSSREKKESHIIKKTKLSPFLFITFSSVTVIFLCYLLKRVV